MENGELKMENVVGSAKGNPIVDKSYAFAIRTVRLYKHLTDKKKEFVISKQLLRCGTAIGALVREAEQAESKADFLHKMNVALKEANEALYWSMILHDTEFLSKKEFESYHCDVNEVVSILVSIVKTTKKNLKR